MVYYLTECSGVGEEWKPKDLDGDPWTLAVNREMIILGTYNGEHVSVYSRQREFLYKQNIGVDKLAYSHLSQDGQFLATSAVNNRLIIFNFNDNSSVRIGSMGYGEGELDYPQGVCNLGNVILVADFNNNRVSTFSPGGTVPTPHPVCQWYISRVNYANT